MLTDRARRATRGLVDPVVGLLARTGVTPNALTVLGCAAHLPVAWFLAQGQLLAGAVALAIAAAVDGFDGSLARATGRASRFGAFLDSSLDRTSEILVYLGLVVWAQANGPPRLVPLVLLVTGGSLMVSYTRARAEGLGSGTKVGVFGRFERMLTLVVGLVLNRVEIVLWVLALGTWATTVHRILDVRRRIASDESAAG